MRKKLIVVSDEIYDIAERHTRNELLQKYLKNGKKTDDKDYFYCSRLTIQYDGERRYTVE